MSEQNNGLMTRPELPGPAIPGPGQNSLKAGPKFTGSQPEGFISPADAVRYFAGKIFERLENAELPGNVSMIVKVARPIFGMVKTKLKELGDDEALEIINGVHSLSFRLEQMTGLDNPFVEYDEE